MDRDRLLEVLLKLFEISHRLVKLDETPWNFGVGEALTRAEIHMLSAVASGEDASVTELARRKRITKGAVSQILRRLEQKGLVEKRADSRNASRLQVRLTAKGRRACRGHDRMHDDIVKAVRHHVGDLDEQTLSILRSALDRLGVLLDRFEVGKE